MPSTYILNAEYPDFDFGSEGASPIKIRAASAIVDGYLRRPEGLVWMPDYQGSPCYMAALPANITFTLTAPITPGQNVIVPIPGGMSITGMVGDVAVIERPTGTKAPNPNNCEACVVQSVASNQLVLASVALTHAAGVKMEFGLTISEQKSLPSKRSITRLASWPIARLVSGLGSYRYGRRNDQQAGLNADASLLALMQTFGGPPEWISFDITGADFSPITNEVWIPSGAFLAYYSDVRLRYLAGYSQDNVPWIIKQATAALVKAGVTQSDLAGGIKMAKAGDTAIQRFDNSIMDADMRSQLDVYRARLFV